MPRPPASNRGCPDPVSQVMNQHSDLIRHVYKTKLVNMSKVSISVLKANLAIHSRGASWRGGPGD